MKKFLLGVLSGAIVTATSLSVFSHTAVQQESPDPAADWDQSVGGFPSGSQTNLNLEKDRPDLEWNLSNILKDDYALIQVAALDPLTDIDRRDIKSVCIQPYINSDDVLQTYSVSIMLSDDARRRIGNALAKRDNQEITFNLIGMQINSFFADAQKARLFETGHRDEDSLQPEDISYSFDRSSTYTSLFYLSSLTGSAEIEGCESNFDIDAMPGYQQHKKMWNEMVAQAKDP